MFKFTQTEHIYTVIMFNKTVWWWTAQTVDSFLHTAALILLRLTEGQTACLDVLNIHSVCNVYTSLYSMF